MVIDFESVEIADHRARKRLQTLEFATQTLEFKMNRSELYIEAKQYGTLCLSKFGYCE
jgi:hypothetical protein